MILAGLMIVLAGAFLIYKLVDMAGKVDNDIATTIYLYLAAIAFVLLTCSVVMTIGFIINEEPKVDYTLEEARCASIDDTTFAEGHCYKNGIELTFDGSSEL